MDVNSIASLATSMSQERLAQDVSVAVLKKALDIEADSAAQLIATIPKPDNLPDNLGQNVNTRV